MNNVEFQKKVDDVCIALYQNKEQEALKKIPEILQILNSKVTELEKNEIVIDEQVKSYILIMYKELYEAYAQKDMLGIADCMQEKVMLVIELCKMNDMDRV